MTFTADDLDKLSRLHVQRAIFARVQFPSGERRLHTGLGKVVVGGEEWEGVTDPFGGQMVSLDAIEEPWFGHAPAIDVVISGANRQWLKQMWDDWDTLDGVQCDLYFAVFDAETGETLIGLKPLFEGRLTAPRFSFLGATIRFVQAKIVSVFEGLNFPSVDAAWSPAGQRKRYPGDKGLDLINAKIIEYFRK